MSAAQLLRSCTASLSCRTFSRPLAPYRHCLARRHYSETPADNKTAAGEESAKEPESSPELIKLKAKEEEILDLTSRLRYLQADFQNLQRNAAREKEQTRDFAVTRFASDLLETVDVLSYALNSIPRSVIPSSAPPSETVPSEAASSSPTKPPEEYLRELYEGVELTQRQLLSTLFKYHVKPFDPTGDKFDPNRHEALFQAPAPDKEPGSVSQCLKIGYTIKDRVLRAAQVGVAQES
ncbi:GrpE nucleotide exchange factor [Mycena floridula]|nr:GrpE nucleotide exchange factor [Mycena floridula]